METENMIGSDNTTTVSSPEVMPAEATMSQSEAEETVAVEATQPDEEERPPAATVEGPDGPAHSAPSGPAPSAPSVAKEVRKEKEEEKKKKKRRKKARAATLASGAAMSEPSSAPSHPAPGTPPAADATAQKSARPRRGLTVRTDTDDGGLAGPSREEDAADVADCAGDVRSEGASPAAVPEEAHAVPPTPTPDDLSLASDAGPASVSVGGDRSPSPSEEKEGGSQSPVDSVESLVANDVDDGAEDWAARAVEQSKRMRRVAFVETNPTPLSPLSVPAYSDDEMQYPQSRRSRPLLSSRSDDEETLTLEDEGWCREVADDDEGSGRRRRHGGGGRRPRRARPRRDDGTWSEDDEDDEDGTRDSSVDRARRRRRHRAGATPRQPQRGRGAEAAEMIPDDESEASLLVLMRYMGCTPMAYGAGPSPGGHARGRGGEALGVEGGEFVFYSSSDDDDNRNSLLSDEEYDTEGTEGVVECFLQDATDASCASGSLLALRNAGTYREEDIEMGIEDHLVLVDPPAAPLSPGCISPGTSSLASGRKRAKKKKEAKKKGGRKKDGRKKEGKDDKKKATAGEAGKTKPNLTVEIEECTRKDKDATAWSPKALMSDEELCAFLSGDGDVEATLSGTTDTTDAELSMTEEEGPGAIALSNDCDEDTGEESEKAAEWNVHAMGSAAVKTTKDTGHLGEEGIEHEEEETDEEHRENTAAIGATPKVRHAVTSDKKKKKQTKLEVPEIVGPVTSSTTESSSQKNVSPTAVMSDDELHALLLDNGNIDATPSSTTDATDGVPSIEVDKDEGGDRDRDDVNVKECQENNRDNARSPSNKTSSIVKSVKKTKQMKTKIEASASGNEIEALSLDTTDKQQEATNSLLSVEKSETNISEKSSAAPSESASTKPDKKNAVLPVPVHPTDLIGTYLHSPRIGAEKKPLLSAVSFSPRAQQCAIKPLQTTSPISNASNSTSGASPLASDVIGSSTTRRDSKQPKNERRDEPSVSSISAAHATAGTMAANAISSASASIAKFQVVSPRAKENTNEPSSKIQNIVSKMDDTSDSTKAPFSVSLNSATDVTAKSTDGQIVSAVGASTAQPESMLPRADEITKSGNVLQKIITALEESPSSRSDKENSDSTSENETKKPRKFQFYEKDEISVTHHKTVSVTPEGEVPPMASDVDSSQKKVPPLSPSKKAVREVDVLLAKTRNWLARHQDAKLTQNSKFVLSSPSDERKVMGNITAETIEKNSKASAPALKPQDQTMHSNLMDQLKPSSGNATQGTQLASSSLASSSSASAGERSKKSIMEQLEEIRTKQKELELRQKARPKLLKMM